MHCIKGDIAIVVKSNVGNAGKIVRCVRFLGGVDGFDGKDRWEVSEGMIATGGEIVFHQRDSQMRPIRNTKKKDEMLNIAGLPKNLVSV